jgi:flagellar biosynthesis protein FlhB
MGEDSGEKTEEPTPHKLKEARDKGQIAKGREVTGAVLLFVSFYTLKATAGSLWTRMVDITTYSFDQIHTEFSMPVVGKILENSVWVLLLSVGPIFFATFITAIIVEALQTGFLLTLEPLAPKLDKLNVVQGLKKMVSLKQVVELLKSIAKMIVVIWIMFAALKDKQHLIIESQQMDLFQLVVMVGDIVMTVVTRVGIFYMVIALLDYFYQRYEYMKEMKMSMKEIKDEYKRLEGDPMIKQRQRDAARQLTNGRQMGAVPGADVVVTNPTHVAVAIEYKANRNKAPIVLAKGQRILAAQIREIAEAHHIPIIENPPLARGIYKVTAVGSEIPQEYYKAMAEVLAFVYNLKKRRKKIAKA